jgi:hypothetical protein
MKNRNLNHIFNLPPPGYGFKAVDYVIMSLAISVIMGAAVAAFGLWLLVAHG